MYIGLRPDGKFIPGQLGMGLVEGIYFSRLLSLYQKKQKQAQRRAAGDRSGRRKYPVICQNVENKHYTVCPRILCEFQSLTTSDSLGVST